jgi:hypothetical protein
MKTNSINTNTPVANEQSAYIDVDRDVYEVQTRLLELVDAYMDHTSPIVAINDLLEKWLTSAPVDLSDPMNKHQLSMILRLIDFLVELKQSREAWVTITELQGGKKEVSGE